MYAVWYSSICPKLVNIFHNENQQRVSLIASCIKCSSFLLSQTMPKAST